MFQLSVPWWELCLRVSVVYAVLLLLVRLSGKRTLGQFTPFDLLVVLLLSEVVSAGMVGADKSVAGAVIGACTLVALNWLVAMATARSNRMQALLEGTPVLIGRDGQLYPAAMKRNHVPRTDVERALREADCDLKDVKFAFLETDGGISILKEAAGGERQKGRDAGA